MAVEETLRTRTAAFLFWDTVGSTALLSRLGDQRAEQVRRHLFSVVREVVSANRGEEVKNTGDGLMVVFPSALADSLSCAVGIQRAVATLNGQFEDVHLAVRVGVAAGDAVLHAAESDWFGRAVNTSARLCGAAPDGEIYVTASLGDMADWSVEPVGPLTLKGLSTPVDTVRVPWLRTGPGDLSLVPPVLQRGEGLPFIGRGEQLDGLNERWSRSVQGNATRVRVGGPVGCGTTRLLREWLATLAAADTAVLGASCVGRSPLEALGAAVDWHAGAQPEEQLRVDSEGIAPLLATVAPSVARRFGVAAVHRSAAAAESAVFEYLRRISRRGSLALVLDDADPSHVDALDGLAAELLDCPILVVSVSPSDSPDDGSDLFVPPLDVGEVEQLLAASSADLVDTAAHASTLIHEETGGVTLQVTDIINALSQGTLPVGTPGQLADAVRSAVTMSCPYRGLKPLRPQDHALFFGREAALAQLIGTVNRSTLTVVTGASGAGKSSVLSAGLVPAVLVGSAGGTSEWQVFQLTPGGDPLRSLTKALGLDGDEEIDDIGSLVGSFAADRTLIVVDQLEELWTQNVDENDRRQFLDLLVAVGVDSDTDVRVVCGIRSDFFGVAAQHPGFRNALQHSQLLLGNPSEDELAQVIEGPAEATGFKLEEGLTGRLTADVIGQSGSLPLLSHALYETWRRREGRVLTLAGYEASGRIEGAIASTAEQVLEGLNQSEFDEVRALFSRLVTLGEGRADTRRLVRTEELTPGANSIASGFVEARLLTAGDGTIEVAHEALIQHWPRLRRWLDHDRDDLRTHRHLTDAAVAWNRGTRDAGDLCRGTRLAAALDLMTRRPGLLNSAERAFLEVSQHRADLELARERRRRRMIRVALVGVTSLLILAIVAGVVAVGQWRRADEEAQLAVEQRDEAELSAIISRASQLATTNPAVALTLASEAYRRSTGAPSQQALISVLGARRGVERLYRAPVPLEGCDGQMDVTRDIVHYGSGLSVLALDLATGHVSEVGERPTRCASTFIGRGGGEPSFAVDLETNQVWITTDASDWGEPIDFDETLTSWFLDESEPDGLLVHTSADIFQGGDVFHVGTDRAVTPMDTKGMVHGFVPIMGQGLIAADPRPDSDDRIGGEGAVWLFDTTSGERVGEIPLDVPPLGLAASRNGQVLGVVLNDSEMRFYDVADRSLISTVPAVQGKEEVFLVALSEDGSVAALNGGGIIKLVDVPTGSELGIEYEADDVSWMEVLDGNRVQLYARDGSARIVGEKSSPRLSRIAEMPNVTRTDVLGGGDLAAGVDSATGEVTRVRIGSGEVETFMADEPSPVVAALPVDARTTVGIRADFTAVRWIDGQVDARVALPAAERSFVVAGDGTGNLATVVAREQDRRRYTIAVLDLEGFRVRTGPLTIDYEALGLESVDYPTAVAREDGGVVVMVPGLDEVQFYADDLELESVVRYPGGKSMDHSPYPSGDAIAFVTIDGNVWKAQMGQPEAELVAGGHAATNLEIAPDGHRALVVGPTGLVSVVDLETGIDLGTLWDGSGALVGEPQWSNDSSQVSIPTLGAVIRLELDPELWAKRACDLIGTPVSEEEWIANAPTGVERPSPC